jgi:hypothetical protein
MKSLGLAALFLLAFAPLTTVAQRTFVCQNNTTQLHQLRVYEVNRTNREPFHQRFQDHALRLMQKHDFKVVDMWESDTGEKLQFIYLLEWPDAKVMDERWKAFLADQEWIDIKKRTGAEHGQLVKSTQGQPLVRVSYSPACSVDK